MSERKSATMSVVSGGHSTESSNYHMVPHYFVQSALPTSHAYRKGIDYSFNGVGTIFHRNFASGNLSDKKYANM
jgi:hypothetical protein